MSGIRQVHVGYEFGPTIAATDQPWPPLWEHSTECRECDHPRWETCLLAADGLHRIRVEEVVRCVDCHAPRCGHTTDEDPCIDVHHHDGAHIPASQIPAWRDDPIARHYGWVKGVPACTEVTCPHGWEIRDLSQEKNNP